MSRSNAAVATAPVTVVRPMYDYIHIEPEEAEARTSSGLHLPGGAPDSFRRGEVVATGRGAVTVDGSIRELNVKKGDRVLFNPHTPDSVHVRIDGKPVLLVREYAIVAVLE